MEIVGNVIIGLLMVLLGSYLVGYVSVIHRKNVELSAKLGVKVRGDRTGKFATAIAMVLTMLLALTSYVVLNIGPAFLVGRGFEFTGLVNWEAFNQSFSNSFAGFLCLWIILRNLITSNDSQIINDAFRQSK